MGSTYTRQSTFTDGDTITADLFNTEFDQLVAAFAATTGHSHDGTAGEGGAIGGLITPGIILGNNTIDVALTFDGGSNDGVLKWMEDEDYFEFSDDILIASTEKLQFRDTAIYINSSADGQLDIVADTEVQIAATTIDINGAVDISGNLAVGGNLVVTGTTTFNGGTLTLGDSASDNVVFGANVDSSIIPDDDDTYDLGSASQQWRNLFIDGTAEVDVLSIAGTAVTSTAAELNLLDGVSGLVQADLTKLAAVDASAAELNILDGKAFLDEDNFASNSATGIASQQSIKAYVDGVTTTSITSTGALNSGSITSGFGNIDSGSSTITTTGLISGGSLDIDNVLINGTTIGHTDDTDLITLADGVVTVAGEVSVTTLDIGGTNVTSTAAELNALDGITAVVGELNALDLGSTAVGTAIASKAVVLDSNKDYTGIRNFTITGDLSVGGTTTVVDTVTMNAQNAVLFEGATADAHETTLTIVDPTADRTINLPNQSGTVPVLAAASNTAVTSTPEELNILDGVTSTAAELNILDVSNSTLGDLAEISTVANDDVFLAIDTSGGGLKRLTRSAIVSGLATSGAISNLVEDTSPQLGGNLDTNSQNILIDDAHFIGDESGNEQIIFQTTGSAVNQFDVTNAASGNGPKLSATGGDTNIDLDLLAKGSGIVKVISPGGSGNSGAIQLNCESNSHGQILKSQPHSASATNTMLLPEGANSTLVSLVSTDTLTNKTLTSPKINEDVAVTSTATELNLLDGVTSTTAELNILDGVTSTAAELNILDGVTSTAAELNILDGVTSTAAELNALDGITAVVGELNALDLGSTAVGTAVASKAMVLDSNKDYTGVRNFTLSGELDAGSLDVSGNVDVDGTLETDALSINGTAVTSTAAELNILDGVTSTAAELNILDGVTSTAAELNILDGVTSTAAEINLIDGGTSRGTTAVADGDGVLINDAGTMRMTSVDTLSTYMAGKSVGGSSIVTTGALNSGTITSGFGNIDTGSSTITTTGLISGGSLDIDNVLINGTTIGHTDDTDLITVADGLVTVAGEVQMTTLDIGGTNVTSTAAELNALDGITAVVGELNALDIGSTAVGTAVASKAMILDSNKDYTGIRNFTLSGELDAGSLDISGNADIDGTLETDALSINGTAVTSTAAELNILDGVTSTAAEINILDGVTSTAAELNILDGVTSTAAEINQLDAITRGSILVGNSSGATARLAKGTAGQVLTSDGTDLSYTTLAGYSYSQSATAPSSPNAGDWWEFTGNGSIYVYNQQNDWRKVVVADGRTGTINLGQEYFIGANSFSLMASQGDAALATSLCTRLSFEGLSLHQADLIGTVGIEAFHRHLSVSNATRGVTLSHAAAGNSGSNQMTYYTLASSAAGQDFGDLNVITNGANLGQAIDHATRGLQGGGVGGDGSNHISYITIANAGNATDFGNLTTARRNGSRYGWASTTRGIFHGGLSPASNVIDYVTIANTGNATDFGNLRGSYYDGSGGNSITRGIRCGGPNSTSVIDFVTMDTAANAGDFGDCSAFSGSNGAIHNATKLYIANAGANTQIAITMATAGNAATNEGFFNPIGITRHQPMKGWIAASG